MSPSVWRKAFTIVHREDKYPGRCCVNKNRSIKVRSYYLCLSSRLSHPLPHSHPSIIFFSFSLRRAFFLSYLLLTEINVAFSISSCEQQSCAAKTLSILIFAQPRLFQSLELHEREVWTRSYDTREFIQLRSDRPPPRWLKRPYS